MLRDNIEESWAYREMFAIGREKGLRQGKISALQEAIVLIVKERFPPLVPIAQVWVAPVEDVEELLRIIKKASRATTAPKMLHALAPKKKSKHK